MARKRLTMKKIKEVIRLKYEAGLSNRATDGACKISNSTVGDYLKRAADAGLGWPLGELGDEELSSLHHELPTYLLVCVQHGFFPDIIRLNMHHIVFKAH